MSTAAAVSAKGTTLVGIAESATARAPGRLTTFALGSCLGLVIYDPEVEVGGLLHAMLPSAAAAGDDGSNPSMFVDLGVPALFRACYELGAKKERLVVRAAGGAFVRGTRGNDDYFEIGKRNVVMLKKLLWKNGVVLEGADLGGNVSRTLVLDLQTGTLTVKTPTTSKEI